jgi:hypothetical protein
VTICSLSEYRSITRDFASTDEDISEALARAQKICEERTERVWERAVRTETLPVVTGGYVYPSSYPVTGVVVPENAPVDGAQIKVTASWFSPEPATVDVTYVGGYLDEEIPTAIKEAVAELAHYKLHPPTNVGIPAGATDVSTNGQRVMGRRLAGASGVPAHIADTFKAWRHVQARSFG